MKQVSAATIAEFILSIYPDVDISPMKLQKLTYYAKVWSLVAGYPCINAQFERWDYGPVNRTLYFSYKKFAREKITSPIPPEQHIQGEQSDFFKFIFSSYIDHSAVALSAMTHKEAPWRDTPPNQIITDQVICDYYSKLSFAKNFQGKSWKEGRYYVLKTNSWYSFTMDMTEEEAKTYESYPSYEEYLRRSRKSNEKFKRFMQRIL
ncbi:MAG: DUF4065 domain-containing protein [Candidatus Electrothrix sp. GM3_4]|nr:DUF4065 domain-containing protein [Candidatus Electrothrix sp. GM3_4]